MMGISLKEAASISGIPEQTLRRACRQGRLPAAKCVKSKYSFQYVIEAADLNDFVARHDYRPRKVPIDEWEWSDADVAALEELQDSCTRKQLADYLGRSVSAIDQKLFKLRGSGAVGYRKTRTLGVAFHIPARAILIAKSCAKCGNLRDASYFRMIKRARTDTPLGYDPNCYHCNIKAGKDRYRADRVREPQMDCNTGRLHKALQDATKDHATRDNYPYTQTETDMILDASKSTLQVALELGRTFYAIRLQRYRHGMNEQTYSDIFPMRKKRRRSVPDTQWVIHFPNALKVLQEHFRSIGDPDTWDLADTELANQDHRPMKRKQSA